MKGRKPRPTFLKIIEGNPGKREIHGTEPLPARDLPEPPDWLTEEARLEWAHSSEELYRIGLLSRIDRTVFAAYCQCCGRGAMAERAISEMAKHDLLTQGLMIRTTNGNAIQNPLVGIANKAWSDAARYAAEFGMTPSARARLDSETPRAQNKFAGLIGRDETA